MYEGWKVFGPYRRKDGRKHVVLQCELTKKLKTISYPKYLMELHLGRYLTDDETVDHKDRDFTNDSLSNLQILPRSDHAKLDVQRRKVLTAYCERCGKDFELSRNQTSERAKKLSGPYCSRSCARQGSKGSRGHRPSPEYFKTLK